MRRNNKARFPDAVICLQCNSADGAVKRKLKLHKEFSFSPEELSLFIKATPHGKHEIDYEIARAIYTGLHI
ncbi:hypothetical protein CBP51_14265 [Cellvibrio mixtus]|uniref:Uncharacterized protein n=1 Tax=Cellvibrio mixtus TaxID=39650 RepID=A0A266Q6Z2_9GAMM|nr:hypothetical protein CBP51_14265 [Cellvibrio mixtus]